MAESPQESDILVVTLKNSKYYSFTGNNRKYEGQWEKHFTDTLLLSYI